MSQRSRLEDAYTVTCPECGVEWINPQKKPRQKKAVCPKCQKAKTEENP